MLPLHSAEQALSEIKSTFGKEFCGLLKINSLPEEQAGKGAEWFLSGEDLRSMQV